MYKYLGGKMSSLRGVMFLPMLFSFDAFASAALHEDSLAEGGEVSIYNAPALFEHSKENRVDNGRKFVLEKGRLSSLVISEADIVNGLEVEADTDLSPLSLDEPSKSSRISAQNLNFVPLCQTLSTNSLYTLSGVQTGGAYCYHFSIPQKSKTTVFLTGQSSATNFALHLFKDDGAGNLTVIGSSNNPGNMDEVILALTETGEYYWYMESVASDGSPIKFAAVPNFSIDSYELNDAIGFSYTLPDKLNTIIGNSDSAEDYDYYNFTAVRGQDVRVVLEGVSAGTSANWILEAYNGSVWQTLSSDAIITISGNQAGQIIHLRVRPNPSAVWNPSFNYRLLFGSKPVLTSYNVSGESNVLRIPYSAPTPGYMTTQAYKQLSWSVRYADSKGGPIAGVAPVLYLWKNHTDPFVAYSKVTDSSGYASGIINLGDCVGDFQTVFDAYSNGSTNTWKTSFNFGQWIIQAHNDPDLGVGSDGVPVTLGHICKQWIVP